MKSLTKDEMKKVLGGILAPEFNYGQCTTSDGSKDATGSWTYTSSVYLTTCENDILLYCSSKSGVCCQTSPCGASTNF